MTVLRRTMEDGVCSLTLARPDSLNAFNGELIHALRDEVVALSQAEDVRCVVLTGEGNAFSAGGDINRMKERMEVDLPAASFKRELRDGAQEMIKQLYHLRVPTIAKVDGPAVGMGCSLALACDLVYAAEGSTFGLTFRNVALGPDTGSSFLLPERVGTHRALELAYTGEIIEADRATEIDLINGVYPADELDKVVDDVATSVADGPTLALAATKRLIKGTTHSLDEAIEAETASQAFLYATDDHEEGVTAFLERRDAEFAGR